MKYAKKMQDKGIEIRLGSDRPNGGKVNISELGKRKAGQPADMGQQSF
jgi:hypothetical protein